MTAPKQHQSSMPTPDPGVKLASDNVGDKVPINWMYIIVCKCINIYIYKYYMLNEKHVEAFGMCVCVYIIYTLSENRPSKKETSITKGQLFDLANHGQKTS